MRIHQGLSFGACLHVVQHAGVPILMFGCLAPSETPQAKQNTSSWGKEFQLI